MYVHTGAFVIA